MEDDGSAGAIGFLLAGEAGDVLVTSIVGVPAFTSRALASACFGFRRW